MGSVPHHYWKLKMADAEEFRKPDPVKTAEAIPPQQLKDVWPLIRQDVASMDAPDHVIPEEVYAMCFTNQATLFILRLDGEMIGHVVVRLILPDLHLWQLFSKPGYDMLHLFKPEMLDLAKKVGARNITFGSSRKAWRETAEKLGFKPRMAVYEMPVE
jgi:hypothetical protein